MFIELVDALRCLAPHEESWLVAAADRSQARHILDGTLGCPVCHASYPIRDGVVDFTGGAPVPSTPYDAPSAEQAMRLAAFLGLSDASGFATLVGAWGAHAYELRALVECPIVLVDPPDQILPSPGLSILRTAGAAIPLANGAARGTAVADERRVAEGIRITRVKGRVVAPATALVPPETRELARDDAVWVAEREPAPSPLVSLHVRRG